jgi:saccharopine dehydrogenase (NAD+, L-lysine-forming)
VVLAVDNLPCELPIDASQFFGDSLVRFVGPLARCDWSVPLDQLNLPPELRRAVIVHGGELTPAYRYLEQALAQAGKSV